MINKRIATGMMSIAGALAIAGGATFAYFTAEAQSAGNTFTAGTMNISVDQNNIQNTAVVSNWVPGQGTQVRFDIVNSSTIPVNLKAFATGSWNFDVPNADPKVKVTKVEYYNGSDWVTIKSANAGITGDVYYSPNGNNSNLMELAPNAREEFRLTVKLDETAGDEFQGRKFTAKIQAQAKQTNAPSFE